MTESSQQIDFYQLNGTTQAAFDEALPKILQKALAAGHTISILAPSDDVAVRLDERLWTISPESFLPHHFERGDDTNLISEKTVKTEKMSSPVTIFTANQQKEAFDHPSSIVISLSGSIKRHKSPQNATIKRVLDMFTTQESQTQAARQRWTEAKKEGFSLNYYAQTDQGWQKKA